jgi:ABC-type polysaccharide/polyol phosphate transport system ATPase subunit
LRLLIDRGHDNYNVDAPFAAASFYGKAQARLRGHISRSRILMVASHSDLIIRQLCNKALWLHSGTLMEFGDVDRVLDAYAKGPHAHA